MTSPRPITARDVLWVLGLGLVGGFINLHAPTVFFDSQIMLGGTLAVFALLRFGWLGLVTAVLALGATALRWGHPFELIIGLLQYTWLLVFLQRFNGGWRNNDNGGIVVAAAAFWLLLGTWLEIALFHFVFEVPVGEALALGLKECVVGIINAALGLLLFLIVRATTSRGSDTAISARGAAFAFTMTVALLPSVIMVVVLSGQLRNEKLESQLKELRFTGVRAADAYLSGRIQTQPPPLGPGVACELREGGRTVWSSDPAFFGELDASHITDASRISGREDLAILAPREGGPVIQADRDSYWQALFEVPGGEGPLTVRVTRQASILINQIDHSLLVPAFSVLLSLLVLGVGFSAIVSHAVGRRFNLILQPTAGLPVRRETGIRELDDVMALAGGTREAREALEANETQLRRILENLPVPVAAGNLEAEPKFTLLNKQFTQTFGYSMEDLPTVRSWMELAYPDEEYRREIMARWHAGMEQAVQTPGSVVTDQVKVRGKDGTDRDVIFSATLTASGPVVTFVDITARLAAEFARAKSDRSMKLAASAAGIGFWSRDLSSNLEEWDDQMLRIYGVNREDFDGRWEPFVHAEDLPQIQRLTARAAEQNITGHYEYRIIRPDGTVRHVRGMSGMLYDSRGNAVSEFGVNFDITEEKEAAERERKLAARHRRELEEKLKTSLNAAAVAHEINQPLSRILLRARLDLEKETGADKETLHALIEDAERVVDTIEKMRVLLRNVETIRQPVDLENIIRSALLQLKQPLREARVKVTHTGPDQSCRVLGDDVQLQMIVTNIVRNAIEAITENDSPRREITIERVPHEDTVEIVIGDSGPGWPGGTIDEALLRTTKRQGSGIGLYVVKTALDNHRGSIEVGRSPLGGAEFRLTFARVT